MKETFISMLYGILKTGYQGGRSLFHLNSSRSTSSVCEVEVIKLKKNVSGNVVLLSRCVLHVIITKGIVEVDQWEPCGSQNIPLIHL